MNLKNLALIVMFFMPVCVFAGDSIIERAMMVQSRLEVLNNLGMNCEAHLQVRGLKGTQSEACEAYLRNMQGEYFATVGSECESLLNWHEGQRQMITGNPGYSDRDPNEAERLIRDMRAVRNSCDLSNLDDYVFLTKPIDTINALSELE